MDRLNVADSQKYARESTPKAINLTSNTADLSSWLRAPRGGLLGVRLVDGKTNQVTGVTKQMMTYSRS